MPDRPENEERWGFWHTVGLFMDGAPGMFVVGVFCLGLILLVWWLSGAGS